MTPDNIQNIVSKIEELEAFKENSNGELLAYCTNTSYPLKDRWNVWKKVVTKSEQNYLKHDFKSPLIKYLNERYIKYLERGSTVGWSLLLNEVDDLYERDHKDIQHILREVTISSILEDKEFDFYAYAQEELMKENFGSYRYDW
jgi:hypothetical protein